MLRFARSTLSVLIFLNISVGILIILGFSYLAFAIPDRAAAAAAHAHPSLHAENVSSALRLTILVMPLMMLAIDRIFRGLRRTIDTIPAGIVFSEDNAGRLRQIGWAMLAISALDCIWGISVVRLIGPLAGWSPTLTGWLAGLMLFVLAEVWRQGAAMRADLEGTV